MVAGGNACLSLGVGARVMVVPATANTRLFPNDGVPAATSVSKT